MRLGVATYSFVFVTSVSENVRSYFLPSFGQNYVDVQKHYKIGISVHFKQTNNINMSILRCYYLGHVGVIIWAKFVAT